MPFLNGKQAEKKQTRGHKMTTELEKEFFETFEIKKVYEISFPIKDRIMRCKFKEVYPKITDEHYLELICLYTNKTLSFTSHARSIKELHRLTLKKFIYNKELFDKNEIQKIFSPNP